MSRRVFLFVETAHFHAGKDGNLSITINTDGSYSIYVADKKWLNSAPTFFNVGNKTYSVSDGGLKLTETSDFSRTDAIGRFTGKWFKYQSLDSERSNITVAIGIYLDYPVIGFQQVRSSSSCVAYLYGTALIIVTM